MALKTAHSSDGIIGFLVQGVEDVNGEAKPAVVLAMILSDSSGAAISPAALSGLGVTYTDDSIANATGASQTIAALSTTRKALIVVNPSLVSWWINPTGGTAAANTAGSFELAPGAMWNPSPAPLNAVTGIAAVNTDLTVVTGA